MGIDRITARCALAGLLFAAAAGAGAPAAAQDGREFVLVSSRELPPGATPRALGLSGRNKTNGWDERYRRSIPPRLPPYVPRTLRGLTLFIAEPVPGGWFAFYRSEPGISSARSNARYLAVLYTPGGAPRWELPLNPFLSRPRDLEIQDIRYVDGQLYFNEACQSYAREAGGRCSALVRVDPRARRVVWRTRALVSNNVFIFQDGHLVAGYGFTAEPDYVYLVSAATGRIVATQRLDSAHRDLEVSGGVLNVVTHSRLYRLRIRATR